MSHLDACQKLTEYVGLSEYEAKAYVFLIKAGPSKPIEISRLCGIPRTKVYSALKKLMHKGFVHQIPSDYFLFAPVSPADCVEGYLKAFSERVQDFQWVMSFLKAEFEKISKKRDPQLVKAWVIIGRERILQKLREMLSLAEKNIDILLSSESLILILQKFNRLIDDITEKGVKIRFYTSNYDVTFAFQELKYICDIIKRDIEYPCLFVHVDEKKFLLANLIFDDSEMKSGEEIGVFSDNLFLRNLLVRQLFPFLAKLDEKEEIGKASPIIVKKK